MVKRLGIDFAFDLIESQQCLDLRCKRETASTVEIVEWFHTDAIARQEKRALQANHFLSMFLVKVNEDFRIRAGAKDDAVVLEFPTKLEKVVDLTVEDD